MTSHFDPTNSKQIFVGRQTEMELFHKIQTGQRPEWIIHIPSPGGTGKTRLLEEFRKVAQAMPSTLATANVIDFYNTANQTPFGMLEDVTRQLGLLHFHSFRMEREHYQLSLTKEHDPAELQDAENRVVDAFLKDYAALLRQNIHIVLLFDTCEEMRGVEPWMTDTLIPQIATVEEALNKELMENQPEIDSSQAHYRTTLVLAGRQPITFSTELQSAVLSMRLPALSQTEIYTLFREGELGPDKVTDEQIKQIGDLAGGGPLYVALSYDWIMNDVDTVDKLLKRDRPFGEKLVTWVLEHETQLARAILYTALAWRRMEISLLSKLVKQSDSEIQTLIEQMQKFSFVKTRVTAENSPTIVQLHDEVRELILKYLWPREGELTRRALLQQISEWYEERIDDPDLLNGEKSPATDEMRSLLAEWLFYQCQLDLPQAALSHECLFRRAVHYLDLPFCELLNQELNRFAPDLSKPALDELRFREALVAFRREQYELAGDIWRSLTRRTDINPRSKATSLMLLVEVDGYTGSPLQALISAQLAEEIYLDLINREEDLKALKLWKAELGQLYNNWGYIHRVLENWIEAQTYYEKALGLPGKRKNLARTLNNLGFVYFKLGDIVKARTNIGRALQYRRELELPYELGLGHNTMGIVMEQSGRLDEAADLFRKARNYFQAAHSERGQALVDLRLGYLNRVINNFNAAFHDLEQARRIFVRKGDKDNLIETLNEIGSLYRHRNDPGDLDKALEYYQESLALSKELKKNFALVDNMEDISVLYYLQAGEARRRDDKNKQEEYIQRARDTALKTRELTLQYNFVGMRAKTESTLGDLEYDAGNYSLAFEHYFVSCQLMAQAKKESKESLALLRRRYDEALDHLQHRLQILPSPADTLKLAQELLARIEALPSKQEVELENLREFLEASIEVAQRPLDIVV